MRSPGRDAVAVLEGDNAQQALDLGMMHLRAGNTGVARPALEAAAAGGDERMRARAYLGLADLMRRQTLWDEALGYARQAGVFATTAGADDARLEARNLEGIIHMMRRDWDAARAIFTSVLIEAGEERPRLRGLALSNLAYVAGEQEEYREAHSLAAHAQACFLLAGYDAGVAAATCNMGRALLDAGDLGGALEHLRVAKELAVRVGDIDLLGRVNANLSEIEGRCGSAERAHDLIGQAIGQFIMVGNAAQRCWALGVYAKIAVLGGLVDEAGRAYEAARETARALGLSYLEKRYTTELGRLSGADADA